MWAAIRFGAGGAALATFLVATIATLETALGSGPFARNSPFVNAVLLDVFFAVLSVSGMTLAAVIAERENTERERQHVVSKQAAMEARLRADEALRESEERLRLAQQAARIGTFDWNIRSGVNTWTPELEAMYGLPPGGFGGTQTAFENLVHPDDRAGVSKLNDAAMKSGQPTKGEWRVVWADGSIHWIAGCWQVFMDASGEPSKMIGVNIDVTERKLADEVVRESEERLRLAQQAARLGTFERDVRTGRVTWAAGLESLYGMPPGSLEGKTTAFFRDLIHPEDRERVAHLIQEGLKTGRRTEGEWRVVWPDGSVHWIAGRWQVVMDESGEPLRVFGVNMDVTKQKQAEQALHAREELLQIFVKHVPAAVAMLDRDMRYLQVSDRWCTDYLRGRTQILGRSHYEVFPDMPERWKEVHRRGLQGETLRADEDHWDGHDGPHWARWEVRPWHTPEGIVGGILIFAEDITRRKQMEEALLEIPRGLIEAQEQERTRIGRELHDDVTQRLAMLALELDQIHDTPSDVKPLVREVQKRMTEISSDVQAMSHDLHSSKLEYLGVAAGIKSWCKEFGERHRMQIDFNSNVSSALPLEVGVPLFRVLQEALHNVIKHSGVRQAKVQLREDSGEIHLIVSDLGKGYDVEAALAGKGLGLTSMRERVRLVNGTIVIESKPVGGTTVHVHVPFGLEHRSQAAG